jgi:hypothetical protein
MKLADDFGDAFDELLELGFIEPAGLAAKGEQEYQFTETGKHFFEWQRKVQTSEMLTVDDFEHRETWSAAIDSYKLKRDPHYKPTRGL